VPNKTDQYLSKREQQIMEVVYREGSADVAAVIANLNDAPSNPAVRTHLRILEAKGHLVHTEEAGKFIYSPTRPRQAAARTALSGLLRTFFEDSAEKVMATLLSVKSSELSSEDLDRLHAMIDEAQKARLADNSQEAITSRKDHDHAEL
jgi:BlaI family penicillinase repressor